MGPERATEAMLRVGRDPRPVMREAYRVFGERGDPEDILAAAGQDSDGGQCFYALLYHALWHEGHGNADEAQTSMLRAVGTTYAQGSGDYMAGETHGAMFVPDPKLTMGGASAAGFRRRRLGQGPLQAAGVGRLGPGSVGTKTQVLMTRDQCGCGGPLAW